MIQRARSTFVIIGHTRILEALVGLKDVDVLYLERRGPQVELTTEPKMGEVVLCPSCGARARVKDRPKVRYLGLPVYGCPMRLCFSARVRTQEIA